MWANSHILQDYFRDNPHLVWELSVDLGAERMVYNETSARDFIKMHSQDDWWNDDIVGEFAACMLKTPYFFHTPGVGWASVTAPRREGVEEGLSEVWKSRNRMNYTQTASLETSVKMIYILFTGGNHWQPAHCGLEGRRLLSKSKPDTGNSAERRNVFEYVKSLI